jgi:cell wall-associated NlpC family hydrolase
VSWAADYVGLPFVDGGRDAAVGLDCWGVVQAVYRDQLGIDLPGYGETYAGGQKAMTREIEAGAEHDETWRRVEVPQPFDVAVMRLPQGLRWGHVGVVADARHVLHTEKASGAVLARMDGVMIRHRIVGFWRHCSR